MRLVFSLVILTLGFVASEEGQFKKSDKVKVGVYYETLCPDSKRFVRMQLYPVKRSSLGQYFEFELYPYGKATTAPLSNGSYEFSCQHGSRECDGNKMHACALKYISSTELQLEFVHCSMSARSPPDTLDECAEKAQVLDVKDKISECANNLEGSQLLAALGEKTHALKPKLYFVPWITYNGGFSDDRLQNSQHNFKGVLCDELKANGQSVSCNGGFAFRSNSTWLFLIAGLVLCKNTLCT